MGYVTVDRNAGYCQSTDAGTSNMKKRGTDAGLFAGFDVGSSFVHYVVLDKDGSPIYSPEPIMHFANPIGAVKEAWL